MSRTRKIFIAAAIAAVTVLGTGGVALAGDFGGDSDSSSSKDDSDDGDSSDDSDDGDSSDDSDDGDSSDDEDCDGFEIPEIGICLPILEP